MKSYYLKSPVKMGQHMKILSLFQVQLYSKMLSMLCKVCAEKRQVQSKKKLKLM